MKIFGICLLGFSILLMVAYAEIGDIPYTITLGVLSIVIAISMIDMK